MSFELHIQHRDMRMGVSSYSLHEGELVFFFFNMPNYSFKPLPQILTPIIVRCYVTAVTVESHSRNECTVSCGAQRAVKSSALYLHVLHPCTVSLYVSGSPHCAVQCCNVSSMLSLGVTPVWARPSQVTVSLWSRQRKGPFNKAAAAAPTARIEG